METLASVFSRRAWRTVFRGIWGYVTGRRGQRRVHGWRLLYRLRTEVLLHPMSPRPVYPGSRRTQLWVDQEVFPRLFKLISGAVHTVVIQMFIWKDDRIGRQMAETLLAVADRGVHVYITKEATGDVFEAHRDFLTTKSRRDSVWQRFWNHPLIKISYDTHRDHAKVYIIDDATLCLTGMNIAEEYDQKWHDYLVEIHGREYVDHYLSQGEVRGPRRRIELCQNTENHHEMRRVITGLITGARRAIVLEHCYLSDTGILKELVAATHRGVHVTLIAPERTDFQHHHANMVFVATLLTEARPDRVRVFLTRQFFHGKAILVDREIACLGSTNLMASSLDDMGEVNVIIRGANEPVVRKLRDTLRQSLLKSKPLMSAPRLGWITRWLSWIHL